MGREVRDLDGDNVVDLVSEFEHFGGAHLPTPLVHPEQVVAFVDRAPAGLVVVDETGHVLYANETARGLLGRDRLVGQRFGFPISRRRTSVIELRGAVGVIRECEMQVTRVRTDGSKVWLATLHDVSHRSEGMRRLLGDVNAGTDILTATSEGLRAPLSAMTVASEDLAAEWERVPPIKRLQLLRRILEQTWHMDDTVTRVLDATALDAGLAVPERAPTRVLDVVLGGLPQVRELVTDFDVDVAEDVTVDVGADHVWTIISNLVTNAAKFAPGPVAVSATEIDGWCRIDVSDHGPGIPEEHRELVFERHRRLPDDEDLPGLGLGLWVVRGLSQIYGGHAWIDPDPGAGIGTRVCVHLPCVARQG